ncbi:Gfo/Idh/MocA family protein [Butyricimonas synergistica]|uniref:Gfo/Idh/MocA family protein n=1 Tax=Butyricimonas synergistica TaxID=544644 RepID=UPI00039B4410|nr:Gfo/Idh/MocA family oxidoreductase [Butyricimonas synergistica]
MKIIVIGLGSMGKRRIRLMSEHKEVELFGIDRQESRCVEVKEKFGITCYNSIDEACKVQDIEAAIISTSPLSHASIIKECLEYNLHVFTEINLVQDGYKENIALAKAMGKVLFLSSTFLYRKETQCIIKKVHEATCPLNYIYHVGQYLPDWHPWESYNNYFIGNPKTNGCREIMAIDLPWIVTAFGPIKDVKALKSKNTELNIQYDDNYLIMLEHKNGTKGVFAVDVIARKPYRHIDVYGEQLQLSWNGTPDSLNEYDIENKQEVNITFEDASEYVEGYATFITENPYREELNAYFKQIVDRNFHPAWDFEKDKVVLDWIDVIEK